MNRIQCNKKFPTVAFFSIIFNQKSCVRASRALRIFIALSSRFCRLLLSSSGPPAIFIASICIIQYCRDRECVLWTRSAPTPPSGVRTAAQSHTLLLSRYSFHPRSPLFPGTFFSPSGGIFPHRCSNKPGWSDFYAPKNGASSIGGRNARFYWPEFTRMEMNWRILCTLDNINKMFHLNKDLT